MLRGALPRGVGALLHRAGARLRLLSALVHPTAQVHPDARIADTAHIGPYCIVGPNVVIGPRVRLSSHVCIEHTSLADDCIVHPFACLGGTPQDLKFDGEASALIVGRACVIREHATLHRGTAASGRTQLGAGVLVMSSAHVAHDCVIDDAVILASGCQLAGHVRVHARAIVGGNAAVHQHSHIGASAMIGGLAAVRGHVPPFTLASGNTARLRGLNLVGLRRMRWANRDIAALHAAYRFIFAPAHATLNPTPRWPAADTIEQRARNVLAATTDAVALQGASTTATDAVREMASFVLAVRRRSALCTAGS